jgi:hypothetical protein
MGSFSERAIIFIALIFLLVFVMLSLLVLVVPRGNTPDELIPFSLASALTADYGADDRSQLVAPVSLQILKDIYRDTHPDASEQEISDWFATSSTAINGSLSSPGPINGSNDPSPTAAQPDPTQSTVISTISATPLKSVTTTITPTTSLINTLVATNNPLQTVTLASTLLPTLNFTVTLPLTLTLITPTNTPAPTNTAHLHRLE